MYEKCVGVLGATSLVGQCLLPLLKKNGWSVRAFSRRKVSSTDQDIQWVQIPKSLDDLHGPADERDKIDFWICVAPIWVLPDYFPMLEQYGARCVIAFSSTSRFTKGDSTDTDEKITALKLKDAEDRLQSWGKDKSIDWVILRPTLIYGLGQDKNISEIVRLIRRFGFFPLLGQANGLRQPVHAEDLAAACLSALKKTTVANRAYNLSGAETITYRDMINRVFAALGRRPRPVMIPLWIFKPAVSLLRLFPRYRHWNMSMAMRMNTDMVFDHSEAMRDLNFQPRKFQLSSKDLPE